MYNNMVCADQERFVSRWIPSNLNVATRSTVPEVVDRGGKLVELRELRKDHFFGFTCINLHIVIGCPGK